MNRAEYNREYQRKNFQSHRDRQKKYTTKMRARANFLVKLYKEMKLWLMLRETKSDEMLTEEERTLKKEYLKIVNIMENSEELGVKK